MKIKKVKNIPKNTNGLFMLVPMNNKIGAQEKRAIEDGRIFRLYPDDENEAERLARTIDVGKIKSLLRCGWSLGDIAIDLKRTEGTIGMSMTGIKIYPKIFENHVEKEVKAEWEYETRDLL